ncbi:MAG: hypothetical protein SAK29_08725 [Scytonema sp. PMC 1069.18]|nr:hypothetical protein [Scytonema sp. PMC 1069.18]MEC4884569.1 hypothetical protein [Scytonema sp. PMC 1070.18]
MPISTTTLEIFDYLANHPEENVQIKGDGKTRTYERVNDSDGSMKAFCILESGEEVVLP